MYGWMIAMLFLIAGTLPAGSGAGRIIDHGSRSSSLVALTFDACETGMTEEYDGKVIDILLHEQVPATLFLSGRWVEKNIKTAKFLASKAQFEIGDHSYYHPHLIDKPDERIVRELRKTQAIIRKVTGRIPRYFRPPYGEVDGRIARLAGLEGLTTIQYDIPSGDPDPGLSSMRIERSVLRQTRGGSIIVFHMNRKGVHTAEFLPRIIQRLRERGFTLVTVGRLLQEREADTTGSKTQSQPAAEMGKSPPPPSLSPSTRDKDRGCMQRAPEKRQECISDVPEDRSPSRSYVAKPARKVSSQRI